MHNCTRISKCKVPFLGLPLRPGLSGKRSHLLLPSVLPPPPPPTLPRLIVPPHQTENHRRRKKEHTHTPLLETTNVTLMHLRGESTESYSIYS